jgi:hypothetical protein
MKRSKRARRSRDIGLRRAKRRGRLRRVLLAGAAASVLAGLLLYSLLGQQFRDLFSDEPPDQPRAAIVDQLSLTEPNPAFVQTATTTLAQAGYAVDYYSGREVTVELYRELPKHNYDLLILRVHSGLVREILGNTADGRVTDAVALMAGEVYDRAKFGSMGEAGRMGVGVYEGNPPYLGIAPTFLRSTMEGRFNKTIIVLMGCDGLFSEETADVFLKKGAGAVIGWSRLVSAQHTDVATERLLQHLLIDGLAPREAVEQTAKEVGPDPKYGSRLLIRDSEG